MALHPDVAKRLRQEVLDQVGLDRSPTFDDIKNMRYRKYLSPEGNVPNATTYAALLVRAVIHETLRVFPPVPQNQRECRNQPALFPKSDRTYPEHEQQPIYVPPNTAMLFTTILTHRNKALWGNDADVFDPNRWLDERKTLFTSNPLMFTPFSAGPRIVSVLSYVC